MLSAEIRPWSAVPGEREVVFIRSERLSRKARTEERNAHECREREETKVRCNECVIKQGAR